MFDTNSPEIQFALEAVRQAANVARRVQAVPAITKKDHSPVTVADFAVQAIIGRRLLSAYPDDVLVAEEDAAELRESSHGEVLNEVTSFVRQLVDDATDSLVCDWIDHGMGEPDGRYSVLNPIDGTKGFLRGGQYAVALALIEAGQVQLGVLGCPNLSAPDDVDLFGEGALIVAVRGEGTWAANLEETPSFVRLSASDRNDPKAARLLRSFESGHTNTGTMGQLVEYMSVEAEPVLLDSQAKYAVLASGRGDLLFRLLSSKQPDYRERIWDQAAGSIVVEEAGGRITDLYGRALDFTAGRTLANNEGVLASNGHLHDTALEALAKLREAD